MNWTEMVGGLLKQYSQPNANTAEVEGHFDEVAAAAPHPAFGNAIADMLRSSDTPPFAQLAAQLFANADGTQKASILSELLSSATPAIRSMLGGAGPGTPTGQPVTPEAAQQISPDVVQQMAQDAEQHDPSIIDRLGSVYSQHPGLIKTLGGAALAVTLAKLANRQQS